MRILLAASLYPPAVGGPSMYAKRLSEALESGGHRVFIVKFADFRMLPSGVRHFVYFVALLRHALRSDGIIAFDTFTTGLPAYAASRLAGRPLAIRIGGDFLWEHYVERTRDLVPLPDVYTKKEAWNWKERIIFRITRMLLNRTRPVFNARWLRDIWCREYAVSPERTHIIENAIDPKVRAKPHTRRNFVVFSRQITLKNIPLFSRAFETAKAKHSDIELEIDCIPREEMLRRLQLCYAVAIPSISDVAPNMALEAIRFGKPFLLTKYSDYAERFSNMSVVVDPLSEDDMVRGILALCDKETYVRLSGNVASFTEVRSFLTIAREFARLLS